MDAEWQPEFIRKDRPSRVSILQLAVSTEVFILDLIHLPKEIYVPLISELFRNPAIYKCGFAFAGDMKMLNLSQPDCFTEIAGMLELQDLGV